MDFYSILEISPEASSDEIKKSFRRLAKKFHPDVNHDPEAESMFKLIYIAYDILKDNYKRQLYDELQQLKRMELQGRMRRWHSQANRQATEYAKMEYEEFEESLLSKISFHSTQFLALLFAFVLLCMGFIGLLLGAYFIFKSDFNGAITAAFFLIAFASGFLWLGIKTFLGVLETW